MENNNAVTVAMIVAMAQNRVIGRNNELPWHLPNDLKYFKACTMGKPIIMGRKTFESIGRPLPGRSNIVVTRDTQWSAPGVEVVHDLDTALALGNRLAQTAGLEELMVIGGEQIYRACLPRAGVLYVTEVHAEVAGDAYFPEWSVAQWQERHRESFKAGGDNPYDYSFVTYRRL